MSEENQPTKERKSPGQTVREAMEAKNWTQSDLAYATGKTTASINQILNDKRSISNEMAIALGQALDEEPEHFARIQAEWDIRNTPVSDSEIGARAKILSEYPLREMIKRGWIDPEHRSGTVEEQVCNFFQVASLNEVPHLTHSAKKTNYDDVPPAQLAWLFRVRKIAAEIKPEKPFSKRALADAIDQLSALRSEPDAVRHVPAILAEAGVRFVVVEGLPSSKIDGVCFWLNDQSPVIGMSLRFDRIDNFWFVLRHECAHVFHGHGKNAAILDEELGGNPANSINEEERVANEEAADFCVPSKKMTSFFIRKKPYFAERDVIAFSKRMGVHPGLVVGQLQRRIERYDFLRKHLVKIRTHLANAMMMDGWGDIIPVD